MNLKLVPLALLIVIACGWDLPLANPSVSSLKFLGEYDIPYNQEFKNTTIGGLSGIDYDASDNVYYLISDDRSAINPARFYTAKIFISSRGIDSLRFLEVSTLLQSNGAPFASSKTDSQHSTDPEAIRYNKKTRQVIWSSEGERSTGANPPVLITPSITTSGRDGKYVSAYQTPENMVTRSMELGPRQNGALEGITFDADFKTLYAAMEEPLYEDGPKADVTKTSSWTRIYSFDATTRKNTDQFAYALETVARPASPPDAFKVNGISEILFFGEKKLLTIERSFSMGTLPCTVRVFLCDLNGATSVATVKSLKETPPAHPISKRLLLNMDDLGIFIDNVEGVTFGPDLPNGHKSLLFISDNNFAPFEKMQLLLFEIIP